MGKRGAPRRQIDKAREFGRLVEGERKPNRRENIETLFFRVHRRNPKWGSLSTMYRLWGAFQKDQNRQRAAERRLALLKQQFRQFQEKMKPLAAETDKMVRRIQAEAERQNPGLLEYLDHQQKKFETLMNDALLKLPPQFRTLLRR
jgi:hypothetical protein